MSETQRIEVKVGQLWRDNDKRMRGRTLTVEAIVYRREFAHKALCRVGAGPMLRTLIRLDRFNTRAFTLLRDENGKLVSHD